MYGQEHIDRKAIGRSIMDKTAADKDIIQGQAGGKGLYEALAEYGGSDFYPYHMPGHKRNKDAGEMAAYFGIDITEIDGFDDLHHAEGILKCAQERAGRLYGAEETFYLVNGSTCGVLAAVMTATERGSEILLARNCHKSVYHAAILQELKPHYYYPPLLGEYGICDGVDAGAVDSLLAKYPACKTVVITSPTYEGIVSDVKAVADVVHRHDGILIVDEAHGAHFGLDDSMPDSAVACGADLVVHSLHKTLPSMTQTALLHVQGDKVDRRRLKDYLGMLQTSSPSYVMMAAMDCCVRYVEEHGPERFVFMRRQYESFCTKISNCKYIRIGKMADLSEKRHYLADWDIGKLVIFVRHPSMNGPQLYHILREKYRLQMEMAAADYVVAIMTIMDTKEGWQRLADALCEIDDRIEEENAVGMAGMEPSPVHGAEWPAAESVMAPAAAFRSSREKTTLSKAQGRICAEFVNLYPPGVPVLVPGERISRDALTHMEEYLQAGLKVQGVSAEGEIAVLIQGV